MLPIRFDKTVPKFYFNNCIRLTGFTARIAVILLINAALISTLYGQSNYQVSPGLTSPSLSPGTATGSYAMSGFESVNPFSGKINFSLPLLKIGGRGSAGYTMNLSIQRNWSVLHQINDPNTYQPNAETYFIQNTFTPSDGSHEPVLYDINLTPGIMKGTRVGTNRNLQFCGNNIPCYDETLTRLSFVRADGTEIEFRDVLYGGKAVLHTNSSQTLSRGTEWVSTDGSNATFIASAAIYDDRAKSAGVGDLFYPSGTLYLADGTRITIVYGEVTEITDRNGNKVTPGKDSLGREITFSSVNNPETNVIRSKHLNFTGTGGAARVVKINYSSLENRLATGSSITDLWDLFPALPRPDGYPTYVPYDPEVVASVVLPDGRKYEFSYNNYGELTEIILPTGGKIEYVWQSTPGLYGNGTEITQPTSSGPPSEGWGFKVYRRVEKRRVYSDNSLESETVYGPATSLSNTVTVENYVNRNGTLMLVNKTKHYYSGSPIPDPTTDPPHPTEDHHWLKGRELKTEIYDGSNVLLRKTENEWEAGTPLAQNQTASINVRLAEVTNTLSDTNLVSKNTFDYDQFNNQTEVNEYDYGTGTAGALKRRTHTDYETDSDYIDSAGAHLRGLPTAVKIYGYQNGQEFLAAQNEIKYDETSLTSRSSVIGWVDPQRTERGNATTTRAWRHFSGETDAWLETKAEYDVLGNLVKTIDAKNNVSTIGYNDNFGAPDGEAQTTNTQNLPLNGLNTFAFPTSATNPLNWTTYAQFDYFTGQAVDAEDINGVVSTTFYDDLLDRPTKNITANNQSGLRRQTLIIYDDDLPDRKVTVFSDLKTFDDKLLKSESFYDGMGRTIESRKYEANGGYVATKSIPFAVVQDPETQDWRSATKVSNPYRPLANEQPVWTVSLTDGLGRGVKVITPDNALIKTEYGGNTVTVTDQAGKKRRSITNALGQLIRVDEPNDAGLLDINGNPAQSTGYEYDVLNNLITVAQGMQARTFVYDSLSRLREATNPESGTIQYVYDNNGNLTEKTDARNIETTYGYDALNRVIQRSYDDSATPTVTYTYDNLTNAKGRLTKVSSSVSETRYTSFDILGRVTASEQRIPFSDTETISTATPRVSTYTYNLSGALIEQTYPSGRVVKNVIDDNGDLEMVKSRKTGSGVFWNYARNFTYTAAGAVSSMELGNFLWESTAFNSQLQPTQIALGKTQGTTNVLDLDYTYNTISSGTPNADNNGNVLSQTITVPTVGSDPGFTAVQTYTYDSLNRLKDATENLTPNGGSSVQTWKQTFTYDRYGNRNFDEVNTTTLPKNCTESSNPAVCAADRKVLNPSINASNNRLSTSDGYIFDNAGNTTGDAQSRKFTYDAENKQIKVETVDSNGDVTGMLGEYWYDGDGKRVKKYSFENNQWITTIFVYDASGKTVAEYSTQLATTPQVSYLTNDHLGSPRINTDANGQVTARHDYQPFGEEVSSSQRTQDLGYNSDEIRKKFTSYERDNETDLDFAQARYYNKNLGRFNSVDPLMASARTKRPQSWNRYSYVWNNPLALIDPDGMDVKMRDKKAEERVLSTLPEEIRKQVQKQIKNGLLKSGSLNKIKSSNENFLDLKTMVNNKKTVFVQTSKTDTDGNEFFFELRTAKEQFKAAKASLDEYKAQHPDEEVEYPNESDFKDEVTKIDGRTIVNEKGEIIVTIADGTGKTANQPTKESAETTAHELYVHGYFAQQGKPWEHEVDENKAPLPAGPTNPVNQKTVKVRERTYKMYDSP